MNWICNYKVKLNINISIYIQLKMCIYQITKHYGRTGNNLLHILSVLHYIKKDDVGECTIAPHKLFSIRSTNTKGCHCNNKKTFNEQILLSLPLYILKELYQSHLQINICLSSTPIYDIGIHIRSGDIFQGHGHKLYFQPPLYFYEKIILENSEKSKVIVFENSNNPVISFLKNKYEKYPCVTFQSGTIEKDITILSQCRTLVWSVGTFCLIPYVISTCIEKMIIPEYFLQNQWFTFDNMDIEIIKLPGYDTESWINSKEQREKLITYKT